MGRNAVPRQCVTHMRLWIKLLLMDGHQLVHQGFRGTASGNGKVADLQSHAYSTEHLRYVHPKPGGL